LSSKDSTVCWCMTGHARVGVRGEGTGTPLGVKWFLACQPCRRDSFPKLRWMESAQRRSQTLREMIFFNGNSRTFYWRLGVLLLAKSVSETIRKAPLAEAQTALGKQKIHYVEHGYLFITEIMWKTDSPRKISLKSGNRLLSYGRKRFLKWRPSAILNF